MQLKQTNPKNLKPYLEHKGDINGPGYLRAYMEYGIDFDEDGPIELGVFNDEDGQLRASIYDGNHRLLIAIKGKYPEVPYIVKWVDSLHPGFPYDQSLGMPESDLPRTGTTLLPNPGRTDIMYHAAPKVSRLDILSHGIDYTRSPEIDPLDAGRDANYLWQSYTNAVKYALHYGGDFDIWKVKTDGLRLKADPYFRDLQPDPLLDSVARPSFEVRQQWQKDEQARWKDQTGIPGAWMTLEPISPDRISYTGPIDLEVLDKSRMLWYSKTAAVDNLSQEIMKLVNADPAARVVADELLPYGDVYVVGGAPRDVVLGKQPKDIDMMARVDGNTIMQVLNAVKGGQCFETGKKFPVYRFKFRGSEIEIALPRTEEKVDPNAKGNEGWAVKSDPSIPVEEDLRRRDFTANAIAVHVGTGEIVDPFNGINDIQNGSIRTVTETSFRDDESRVLRALTQMAKHGLVPDDTTKEQMREYAQYLSRASRELVQQELDKIMRAGNPHMAIRLAYETGVLSEFIPEVNDAFGFDQLNPHHELDLGSHLLEVLENVLEHNDPDLNLAALLHDIGKPASQWIDDQGIGHYYRKKLDDGSFLGQQHEEVGANMARERMKELKYPNDRIDAVTGIIQHHMFPAFSTLKGARKFMQQVGGYDNAVRMLKFRRADQEGKGTEGSQDIDLMQSLVDQVAEEGQAFTLKDLAVNGKDLIQAGVPAGPEIGRKLNVLLEEVIGDPTLNDREKLLDLARIASAKESYYLPGYRAAVYIPAPYDVFLVDTEDVLTHATLRNKFLDTLPEEIDAYSLRAYETMLYEPSSGTLITTNENRNVSDEALVAAGKAGFAVTMVGAMGIGINREGLRYNRLVRTKKVSASKKEEVTQEERELFYTKLDALGMSHNSVSLGKDDKGYFCHTHRQRSKSYEAPDKIPEREIKFTESTGSVQKFVVPYGPPMAKRSKNADVQKNRRLARARPLESLEIVVELILENGGGTFDPASLDPFTAPGYFASVEGQEVKVPLAAFNPFSLDRFIAEKEHFFVEPGLLLGAWVDDGQVYLDISHYFLDLDEAMQFGRDNNQLAIYDGVKGEVINLSREEND